MQIYKGNHMQHRVTLRPNTGNEFSVYVDGKRSQIIVSFDKYQKEWDAELENGEYLFSNRARSRVAERLELILNASTL